MQIIDKVKEVIAKQLRIDISEISDDAAVVEDLGADSLDVVDIIMAIEDEFKVEVPDTEVENIKTVGDVVNYIENAK